MKRYLIISLYICLALSACRPGAGLPAEPDYADTAQWFAVDRGGEADLFYITSTETGDYMIDGRVQHHADVTLDSIRALLLGEMQGVDRLLAGGLNFYSPYYRQCTMESFADDSLVDARMPLALGDVRRAFEHYIEHINCGRPFVLAGFSQGAAAVVDLLKTMDDDARSRMAAAYVIGWKVTDDDIAAAGGRIRAAQDSADLGVTVCFNSVRSPECAIPMLSHGNRLAINPVGWRTDETQDTLDYRGDTLTIHLDTASRLLVVDGYRHDDYMLPLIGREGNYHRLDITLYAGQLRCNMALRTKLIRQKLQ